MSGETALEPVAAPAVSPIRFVRRGEIVSLSNVPPSRTLLELLRDDLACTGTKEGCGEGDCGACTVVLGEEENGSLRFRAVNSCIRLAHSIDGLALWTVEDLAAQDGTLHPAQKAMVQAHASQCGFCTPGFVMSLFAMYQKYIAPTLVTACTSLPPEGAVCRGSKPAIAGLDGTQKGGVSPPSGLQGLRLRPGKAGSAAPAGEEGAANPITRAMAVEELSGNLCRCTGYRPILDAAQGMSALPRVAMDEANLLSKMELLAKERRGLKADFSYKSPRYLRELLKLRAAHPDAQLVAGCTDVGLWVTRQHQQFNHVIDVSKVRELRRIHDTPEMLAIGAAVTLVDAFAALVRQWPQLHSFAARFAGLPVRNSGTLGGNVANGSPIGDSMPLLIALGARVVLMTQRGSRELPLEQLYTGYRQNVMTPDEVLAWIKVPRPGAGKGGGQAGLAPSPLRGESWGEGSEQLQVYKISKRFDDDISAVCLAIHLQIEGGVVTHASIGAGGVAATPMRAGKTEAALLGEPWNAATVQSAIPILRAEFSPISDMRASSSYRREVLGNLLQRYWLESQGLQQINLQAFTLEELA